MNAPVRHPVGIRGRGGLFGGSASSTGGQVAADTIDTHTYGKVLDVLSEGPILGLVDQVEGGTGSKSISLNGTPLQNQDGSFNFLDEYTGTVPQWAMSLGTPDQDWLPGFSDIENEVSVATQVTQSGGPVVRTTSNPDIDAITVTVRIPQLYHTDTTKGNVGLQSVSFSVQYQVVGDIAWYDFPGSPYTVTGKSTSGIDYQTYNLVRQVGDLTQQLYNVRVTRVTADAANEVGGTASNTDDLYFFSYTEIIEARLTYKDTAYAGIQAGASAFGGSMPSRAYEIYGRIVRVPSNYNATSRQYSGIWDGSFVLSWTDNPAWCLLDMLTHKRYGLGLTDAQIDIAGLYTIAQYCDEQVPDGLGGFQPRYTLNCQITDAKEAYNLISDMVSAFVGMVYYSAGMVSFTQDSPRSPDMLVTQANVIDGIFDWSSATSRGMPNTVVASWVNPLLAWTTDYISAEDLPAIAARGQAVRMSINPLGVTDLGRALRMARWGLYTQLFDGEVVVFRVGLDHSDIVPGMVIELYDPARDGTNTGGRIVSNDRGSPSSIVLDREVDLQIGHSYEVSLLHANKSSGTYDVLTESGVKTDTLLINTSLGDDVFGGVWALYDKQFDPVYVRVVSRRVLGPTTYEISAILHHPDKYDRIESGIALDADDYTSPVRVLVASPTNLSRSLYYASDAAAVPQPVLLVSWDRSTDPTVAFYTVQYAGSDGIWREVTGSPTKNSSIDIFGLFSDTYQVRVRGETLFGVSSNWLTSESFAFDGINGLLTFTTVSTFGATGTTIDGGNGYVIPAVHVTWDAITSAYVTGVKIEYNVHGDDKKKQIVFHDPSAAAGYLTDGIQAGTEYDVRATIVTNPPSLPATFTDAVTVTTPNEMNVPSPTDTAPDVPSALSLANTHIVQADGSVIAGVAASWDDVSSANLGYYDVAFSLDGVTYRSYFTGTASFKWDNQQIGSTFSVKVRSVSKLGVASDYCTPVSITVTGQSSAPDNPSNLAGVGAIRTIGLSWTNPSNPDLAYTEIWRSESDDRTTAGLVGTTQASAFADTGLTAATTYYYWIRAVNTSAQTSDFNAGTTSGVAVTTAQIDTPDILAGAITADTIAAGAVVAAKIAASAITAGKIATGAIDAGNIIVDNIIVTDHLVADAATAANFIAGSDQTFSNDGGEKSVLSLTIATETGSVLIDGEMSCSSTSNTNSSTQGSIALKIDGTTVRTFGMPASAIAGTSVYAINSNQRISWLATGLAAGNHTIELCITTINTGIFSTTTTCAAPILRTLESRR